RVAAVVGTGTHGEEALGGDHEPVPLAPQPAAQDLLGAAGRLQAEGDGVAVGRVDEVHAALRRPVQDAEGRRLVALVAEGHGAKADVGDLEAAAAEGSVLHHTARYATRSSRSRCSPGPDSGQGRGEDGVLGRWLLWRTVRAR